MNKIVMTRWWVAMLFMVTGLAWLAMPCVDNSGMRREWNRHETSDVNYKCALAIWTGLWGAHFRHGAGFQVTQTFFGVLYICGVAWRMAARFTHRSKHHLLHFMPSCFIPSLTSSLILFLNMHSLLALPPSDLLGCQLHFYCHLWEAYSSSLFLL